MASSSSSTTSPSSRTRDGYTIFGEVTEGLDIVDRIAAQGTGGTLGPAAPAQPISILDIDLEKAA